MVDETLIVQIIALVIAGISAYSAYQMVKGNRLNRMAIEQWSKTLVQPRIFVHGSLRDERVQLGVKPHRLAENQLNISGIFVENIGRGPAVKGIIYVIDHQNNKIPIRAPDKQYSFLRIPAGHRYHFPSYDSRELEPYIRNQEKIRIQVDYFDINDNRYSLPTIEENVDLTEE